VPPPAASRTSSYGTLIDRVAAASAWAAGGRLLN
jgi:hypothetical protein